MNENKTNINWYPGHMAKTKRQIIEDLKLIDVVVEILDASIPLSSQNPDVKGYTKNKKKVVVLNKTDLADEIETKKWVKYFEEKGIPAQPHRRPRQPAACGNPRKAASPHRCRRWGFRCA